MMSTLNTSDLCPLTTRLLPKELSHAFGVADERCYDSREQQNEQPSAAAAAAPVASLVDVADAQAGSNAGAQLKRKASEQQQGGMPAAVPASSVQQPAASLPQSGNVTVSQTAPLHGGSLMQAPSTSQQQATSNISAGLQQAAVVGGQLRGFPTAYISSHSLLPYAQQTVAALPHLSGALPVAMYSPADLSAVMALQQQQQQQLDEAEELQARALKRPRLVWTPQLHKLFEEAVQKIGINKAVPKTIMQMMNVDGLTRENVASHLQKYRLSLRKGPDGEFITTVTEGTETSAPEAANSAGGTTAGARTANTATAATGSGSSDAAGDSAGAAAAGDAAGGVSSDAGTGAVAGSRGDAGTEAGSGAQPAAAAAGGGGPAAGGSTGVAAGDMGQQPQAAAAVAAAAAALADAAAGASGAAADAAT